MKTLSFRQRLAIAHLAAIITVLALTAFGAYWSLARAVHGQLDAALLALAETEQGLLPQQIDQPIIVHEVTQGMAPSFIRLDRLVQIIDDDGHPLARSANLGKASLPAPPSLLAALGEGRTVFQTLTGFGDEPVRLVTVPITGRGRVRGIQVAGSLDDVNNVVRSASLLFVIMGVALFLALGFAGASLTRRVFAAIDDVVKKAHRIGETNLGERLPHPGTRDEIGRLVDTLNAMLDRLERGFEGQRRFTADASHELRSPLSRLRTELEIALRRPREASEYVDTLHSCLEEVERLTVLVDELLALARLDAGQDRGGAEHIALDRLIGETAQRFAEVARERGVHIDVKPAPSIVAAIGRGPASMILANLLDNAVKFSPPGGTINVSACVAGEEALLTVTDQGPGIRSDELPHVFERFYRGQAARAGTAPGVGLGLALSQAIARAYGGRIEAAPAVERGASFLVRFPLSSTSLASTAMPDEMS